MAAVRSGLDVEPILDVLPVPLILVEPGSARMIYANTAAHELAGGALTLDVPAEDYPSAYRLFDSSGRPLAIDEMPAVRAARGETLSHVQVDWETPGGLRTVLVSGSTIALDGGRRVTVVTFEDVSQLEGARRRSTLIADELRVMLDNVADAITVQSPDHKLIYANEAASRYYGIPQGQALDTFSAVEYLRRFEATDDLGQPLDLARLPGRLALAGLDPEPVIVRSRDLATGRGALGADQGLRRLRPRRRRAAGDQRDRGHHGAQALRGGAALPGRGEPAALGLLARLST